MIRTRATPVASRERREWALRQLAEAESIADVWTVVDDDAFLNDVVPASSRKVAKELALHIGRAAMLEMNAHAADDLANDRRWFSDVRASVRRFDTPLAASLDRIAALVEHENRAADEIEAALDARLPELIAAVVFELRPLIDTSERGVAILVPTRRSHAARGYRDA